ncbi:multiple epidermal growth factor-like domains 10 [Elysia marginata]|uniref:Multiple epidermal growth factor-like domains 10 n=1 Tax=Elysia marginata TaxID=1093978 RepID=A0AAV4FI84_9GAST|nr:multiple epidermal growth factor-like domains 10 [Elysia marginata]
MCEQKCKRGTYGENCAHNCSSHCKGGDQLCNYKSGQCDLGCVEGYTGEKCLQKVAAESEQVCRNRTYGTNCLKRCSEHCAGPQKPCHPVSGACSKGCSDGYIGPQCLIAQTKSQSKAPSVPKSAFINWTFVFICTNICLFASGIMLSRKDKLRRKIASTLNRNSRTSTNTGPDSPTAETTEASDEEDETEDTV